MLERVLNTPVWEDMAENIGENMVLKYVTLSGDVHLEIVKKPFVDKIKYSKHSPLDVGRKLNVHKTFKRRR